MKLNYKPQSQLEKFGEKVFNSLVENFPQTFYIGGMVRDLLLGKKVTDIDIATTAAPSDVVRILSENSIPADAGFKRFGVIVAKQGINKIEIATFRKDLAGNNRYPKVTFVTSPKTDSHRRDFTINALYLSPKNHTISDFHNGLKDLKAKKIKFIGNPKQRIYEDPLRIIRALRFAKTLNFKLDSAAKKAVADNYPQLKTLTDPRIKTELKKVKNPHHKNFLKKNLQGKFLLDNK